jgi:hypothetical protein
MHLSYQAFANGLSVLTLVGTMASTSKLGNEDLIRELSTEASPDTVVMSPFSGLR